MPATGDGRKGDAGIGVAAPNAAKGDENGQVPATCNKEARKPKTAKPTSAAPVSPFAPKSASPAASPPKRKG